MIGNSEHSGVELCASMYKVIFISLNNRHAKAKYTCPNLLDMIPGSEVIEKAYPTQLMTTFILLINDKMPTIVGILTSISMINTISEKL